MSYILEALKKSTKERQYHPTSLPLQDLAPLVNKKRKSNLPLFLVIIIIVIGFTTGGIFWSLRYYAFTLILPELKPTVETLSKPTPQSTVSATTQHPEVTIDPIKVEPAPIYDLPYETQGLEQLDFHQPKYPELMTIKELPVDTQSQLPKLKIAGHTYSQEPAARLILINDKILREGHKITNDLILQEITPEGVVLNYKSIEFQALVNF